jgi:hypothetical protein
VGTLGKTEKVAVSRILVEVAMADGKITTEGKILRTLQSKSPKDFTQNNQNKITNDNKTFIF